MRVGLVACAKTKLDRPAPARELYASPLFRSARDYCEARYDVWYVLSAKHGLVPPEDVLAPYDRTLAGFTVAQRSDWGAAVADALRERHPREQGATFHAHAGQLYCRPLRQHGVPLLEPLGGLAIGERLGWYRRVAAAIEPGD